MLLSELPKEEWIGTCVSIAYSTNPSHIGIVVDVFTFYSPRIRVAFFDGTANDFLEDFSEKLFVVENF